MKSESIHYDFEQQLCSTEAISAPICIAPKTDEKTDFLSQLYLDASTWNTIYEGFGHVEFSKGSITLEPKAANQKDETHAALILNRDSQILGIKNFVLEVDASTLRQLRSPTPNAWECLWIFFNYQPNGPWKETNYFTLKPNGTEIGHAYGEVEQDFLFTSENPMLKIGQTNHFRIEKYGTYFNVLINGNALSLPPDLGALLYSHSGAFGFYTEDARVRIDAVKLQILDESLCCE